MILYTVQCAQQILNQICKGQHKIGEQNALYKYYLAKFVISISKYYDNSRT